MNSGPRMRVDGQKNQARLFNYSTVLLSNRWNPKKLTVLFYISDGSFFLTVAGGSTLNTTELYSFETQSWTGIQSLPMDIEGIYAL